MFLIILKGEKPNKSERSFNTIKYRGKENKKACDKKNK